MHPPQVRARARELRANGYNIRAVARALSLPYNTVWHWCVDRPERAVVGTAKRCFRCSPEVGYPTDPAAYPYLLGLYLGDGHLAIAGKAPVLRIACTAAYPRLIDLCEQAMLAVLAAKVQRIPKRGCVSVESSGVHWPCLLPQHGPGKKHERPIVLADWQRALVAARPGDFARGLFHSDGCRVTNRVTMRGRGYVYPRYLFSNESADIMGLCQWALGLLGVAWRMNRPNSLSVARREAVAVLDRHVGPKS
ncbi:MULTISPECIES: transcriptional regulator [unclassified Micromonospora]|uniref:transcriptional regulator n=1 Tax=unclassified Micromonospora TaxID=2617518 RepID=UPI00241650E5|nr:MULTISPECIES: transcriptional regulator [unclassified Micromonospora]MDG4814393.1 transcriptional regulator [Micromonospora sp. WMMD956]WFE57064.1 transcriptional regulator [Micromonospora sp. WMMD712]